MKKKIIIILLLILSLGIYGCGKKTDAEKFKEEYESINGEKIGTNTVRKLEIPENNPFVYKEAKDIVKAIDDKETFVVYFGFASCPWCRSVLPSLIKTAEENNIEKIYYVDVKNIRNTLEYDGQAGVYFKETKKGDEDYNELLELLKGVLSDYKLSDPNGNPIVTGQKRIYAPNIVVVDSGIVLGLKTGITELLTDSYMELTTELTKDIEAQFNELFSLLKDKTCTPGTGC